MIRRKSVARPNWQTTVEAQGFLFHTAGGDQPYWDESVYYQFTSAQVDEIEAATYTLNDMMLAAVEVIVTQNRWDDFDIGPIYRQWIADSWEREAVTIVGRFDLAFDGSGPPKLLEYNADTPTSLLEAAVVQWYWMKDVLPKFDQFNSIHERLIEAWQTAKRFVLDARVNFVAMENHLEDFMTVNYLRDTAIQAGLDTAFLDVANVGWNDGRGTFVDPMENALEYAFKLYPWEWMLDETFGPHLPAGRTRWFEPPWKVLMSNKAILAVLWELYPDHPNLVPASLTELPGDVVRKPRQSREGANVRIVRNGSVLIETAGEYDGPTVWQQYVPVKTFDGFTPVIGSWMVNGYACGMGVREDPSPVTGNLSRFVPHVFS